MRRLRAWFCEEPGRSLLQEERRRLEALLADLRGYHLLQIGCAHDETLLAACPIRHRVRLASPGGGCATGSVLQGEADLLPLASESVDLVVLLHALEFHARPYSVLQEAHRVVLPDGYVLISGFNPLSLWGLARLLPGAGRALPRTERSLTTLRLRTWLGDLGLEPVAVQSFFFRPPLRDPRFLTRLQFLEGAGGGWWRALGAAYLLLAKKRVIPLTPIRPRWGMRRRLMVSGLAEPSARGAHDGQG
jgi:SAM-dependent methyltransferase